MSFRHHLDPAEGDPKADQVAHLVRARWVILLILFVYSLYAGAFYSFSRFSFFLTTHQASFLLVSFFAVVLYNLSYQNASRRIYHFRYADHLQVFLDMLLVTMLVHFTGGAASWVWPLYLMVSIEGVYLLERRWEIWFTWGAATMLYGALLICEHGGIVSAITMPFADPLQTGGLLYLLLVWFWMAILNAAVSVMGFHLMSVSRSEKLELKESRERIFAFLEHSDDLIQLNGSDGSFIYANRAWLRALGYQKTELPALTLGNVVHSESRERFEEEFQRVLTSRDSGAVEAVYLNREGGVIDVEGTLTCSFRGSEADGVWGICRDVTLKKRADQELYRKAHHDVLTGLPNRQLFMDRLQQLRAMMNRMDRVMAVLYLDLDRFKSVNDTLGHDVGDQLLQEVGRRLTGSVRETDTVARLGGDEFVIALGNLKDVSGAGIVAEKVLKALAAPYRLAGQELEVTSSIGIAMYPEDADMMDDLLKKADMALYGAKREGRNCYRNYGELKREEDVPSPSGRGSG